MHLKTSGSIAILEIHVVVGVSHVDVAVRTAAPGNTRSSHT